MDDGGDLDAIARYGWNVMLAESLYPTLQTLEVALRNTIHQAACRAYHSDMWFDGEKSPLHEYALETIGGAKAALMRWKKPLEADRIVAELNFGFWTSLLNSRYDHVLWPKLLKPAFPYLPAYARTRRILSGRFNDIRKLRNRVFHHERIIHLQELPRVHAEIIEAIGWINPTLKTFACEVDRFPHVHGKGLVEVRALIRSVSEVNK